jgi:CheY-like chemotaxis protein/anti-sigma regulatory factor (Ser/Thr protein kinase)
MIENNPTANPTVLVVDDEIFNLDLITDYLNEFDIDVVCVERGEQALTVLQESPDRFSAILLDRMMPGMDGIEVLTRIKSDEMINRLPVIMQTASSGKKNMLEGLNAGAYYYLSKPYDQATLIAIVKTAVRDYQHYVQIQKSLKQSAQTLKMMDKGVFNFKSLEEGRSLATLLANACPDSERVVLGLTELIINAVEHGNLGITYKEKSILNAEGGWESEIVKRLASSAYKDKTVTVEFTRNDSEISFLIIDQGKGFDWQKFMKISPDRAFDSHGRGIALANSISFKNVEYLDNGNKVCVTVPL